ncbi:MAG: hypothetical protein NC122_08020 [Faecalibacterium sp.]|nr:hypothetical protein [Ruminococcus sp.]MCM1391713.1 hypothetical protein [Ruminococcus sp.]MCM1486141.1 hypothetical protein [Faecalibacterium sp.]
MPKLIAFYGSPGSGKTSVALKAAMETYMQTKDEVIAFLSPDMTVPSIALLFPNYAPDEVVSLSEIFDSTAITTELLLKNAVTAKNMKDFFALGFKAGENRYSFPTPTPEKINSLFSALPETAGYIFVDCTNDETDEISKKALAMADIAVRIITPDLKGMSWYSSNKHSERTENEDLFNVVNVTEKELYLPTEEVCTKLHTIAVLLPYSRAVKQQMLDGRMYERLNDKAYTKKIQSLVSKIM